MSEQKIRKRRWAHYSNICKFCNGHNFLLNTSKSSSLIFAELEYELKGLGKPVSILDLMIASICIAERKTLVTSDEDFARIPGLSTVILLN